MRLATKLDDLLDARGDSIELLLGQGPQAAVEELDFPAEIPLQEPRPRMSSLIGADMMQKRKLSFYEVSNSRLPKWEVRCNRLMSRVEQDTLWLQFDHLRPNSLGVLPDLRSKIGHRIVTSAVTEPTTDDP